MTEKTTGYEKAELEFMTTYQLREICFREKIINGIIDPLDKEELIRAIMRYKGKRADFFIGEEKTGGKERLEAFLSKARITWLKDEGLYCGSKILAYEGLSIEYYDGYTIPYRRELAGTNALLIGSDMEICTIFNIKERKGDRENLYLTKHAEMKAQETRRKDYRVFCVNRRLSECLYRLYYGENTILPEHIEIYGIPLIDFVVKQPVMLTLPLAIDFGSVNTTAGVYLDKAYFESIGNLAAVKNCRENEINYTIFEDGEEESILLPSVIGVAVVEENDYKLLYGYDAVRMAEASYIDEGFCVFYDVKRWIGEYGKEEEIVDRQGRRRLVRRADLLQRFFLYIIHRTENRFKCRISRVHISSPVKQKYYFRKMFETILPDYRINTTGMLDEGMAVLYNTIAQQKDSLAEDEFYEALMIDCGGGTTDLCSYRFRIRNRKAAYQIEMETTYENGDTDFGGNNLTYRIMQLLKIALVYAEGSCDIKSVKEILEYMDTDVYRFVDAHGVKEFYRNLEQEYAKAETALPTRFADFERYNRSEYYKVKNNFYTLFHTAEQIKKTLFGKTGILEVRVSADCDKEEEGTILLDKWKLSFRSSRGLAVKKKLPVVALNYFAIELLLSGEIYGIVRKFMEELYQTGRIQDFSFIRLTGQSCKINLFRDALKEFVPGRMIQFRKRAGIDAADFELKMMCVDGALKYLRDKRYGLADIHLDNGRAVIPYRITAHTHNGNEVVLVDGFRDWSQPGSVLRRMEDLVLPLYLKDASGEERCLFQYICRPEDFDRKSYEEIHAVYGSHILQKETDNIENGDVKFFVWARQEEWGFQVVPVYCDEDELFLGKGEFFGFENDNWVNSFFDGRK